jgi:hypothetical protein
MILQILLYAVVVEQRIVDIDQEDNRMKPCHSELRQPSVRVFAVRITRSPGQ